MPLSGLSVNNPQEQLTSNPITTDFGAISVTYGGNVIGGGSTSTEGAASDFSTILLYGIIGLVIIFIFQRLEN